MEKIKISWIVIKVLKKLFINGIGYSWLNYYSNPLAVMACGAMHFSNMPEISG